MSEVGEEGAAPQLPAENIPQNPIETLDPASLNALFDKDPVELTDTDIDQIISYFRSERAQWQQAEATGTTRKVTAAKRAAPKPKSVEGKTNVSLDDLTL